MWADIKNSKFARKLRMCRIHLNDSKNFRPGAFLLDPACYRKQGIFFSWPNTFSTTHAGGIKHRMKRAREVVIMTSTLVIPLRTVGYFESIKIIPGRPWDGQARNR